MAENSPGPTDRGAMVLVRLVPGGPVLCDPRSPLLRGDDVGALRGDGVFERFLVDAGAPRHLEDHLARMARSAEMVELALPDPEVWEAAVCAGIRAWNGPAEWEMRMVCTRGPEEGGPPTAYLLGQQLTAGLLRQRRDGVAAVTIARGLPSGLAHEAPWLLLGAKTLSYAVNMAAKRWAESHGADDAIFVGADGEVWESGTSAVVAAFGRRLVSPPTSVGILDSISVARLFTAATGAGWDVSREGLDVDDLVDAEGLWLSSSLRFARVHTLNGKSLPDAVADAELVALAASS